MRRVTKARPLTSVFRVDEARGMTRVLATLIDALKVAPATKLARIWDVVATLAVPTDDLRSWVLTQRGVDRVTAEADGRLETFFDPTSELAPATWSES